MRLYIIRHAVSIGNKNPLVYKQMNDSDIPLAEDGYEQANEVAIKLKSYLNDEAFIITSPYTRAKQTTNIIASHFKDVKIVESPLIYEREWGKLRDEYESFKTREERNHLFDFYRRPDNGESFADCYQRAWNFLNWLKTQDNQLAIIVSHGEFIKMMLMIIDNIEVEDFETIPKIKNCELIVKNF